MPKPLSWVTFNPAVFSPTMLPFSERANSALPPQAEGDGAARCHPLKTPQTASLLSLCLLSSRGHGHRQWLGEAVLAKVPGDPDGGEVQFIPFRG